MVSYLGENCEKKYKFIIDRKYVYKKPRNIQEY
jgi:hypothetical protein